MNKLATISMFEFLKKPIDSLCVEMPPVAIVVIAWLTLSKIDMPKTQYKKPQRKKEQVRREKEKKRRREQILSETYFLLSEEIYTFLINFDL